MASPRPLRADAERNRHLLLAAARQVFAARGLDAPVDDVARAAGVGVGTLYRRFPDKDALVEAALADGSEDLLATMAAAIDGEEDPWAALAAAMAALVAGLTADRAFYEGVAERYASAPWAWTPRERLLRILGDLLDRARADGLVREDLAAMDLLSLAGVLSKLPPYRLEEQPRLWERYLAVVLDGLRAGAASGPLPHRAPRAAG